MKTIRYILFFIPWVLFHCGPVEHPPAEDLGFFPLGEIKDYHSFKDGTWWIYKNMIDSRYDTVYLHKSRIDTQYRENITRKFSYENIDYTTTSTTLKENYHFYNEYGLSAEPVDWKYFYNISRSRISNANGFEGVRYVYSYPYSPQLGGVSQTIFRDTFDQLIILGKSYNNVVVFDVKKDDSWDEYPTRYYWAKNYGLIKREKFDVDETTLTEGWELFDSFIVQ
jgi:hypothetical protein